jgi:hypothetical protein
MSDKSHPKRQDKQPAKAALVVPLKGRGTEPQ